MRTDLFRKRAVTLLGAVLYALFASLGYRAQGHGHVDIPHALLVALALAIGTGVALIAMGGV